MSITIAELEKSNLGPVWVLNQTKGEMRSVIQFSVPKIEGQGYDAVVVPATIAPVNIAEQVSKKQIMQSSHFRKSVLRGLVSIISEVEAQTLLNDPNIQKAYQRMQSEFMQISQGETLASTGASTSNEESNPGVSPRIISFSSMLADSNDEDESLATLMNIGDLTEQEKDVIRKAAAEKGFKAIVDYVDGK